MPNPGYANGIVYLITHRASGKQYVGLTIQSLEQRWQNHIEQAAAGHIKGPHSLHAAIRAYGPDAFEMQQIDRGTTKKDLEQKERHWIKTYGTLSPDGYNTSPGGESGGSLTKPTMVDGLRFDSVTQAAAYVSKTRQISLVAAEARIRNNRIDVKTPAKPGESLVKTKIYKTWSRIVHGAMNPKSKDYIPGLGLHSPWRDFATFYQDVGQPPDPDMAFTRLDQAKGFYPDNCLWLSKTEAGKINAAYMKMQGTLVGKRGARCPKNVADAPQSQPPSLGTLAPLPTLRKRRDAHDNQQLWLFPAESA